MRFYASNYIKSTLRSTDKGLPRQSLAESIVLCNNAIHLKAREKILASFQKRKALSTAGRSVYYLYSGGFSFTFTNMFTIWNEDQLARQQPKTIFFPPTINIKSSNIQVNHSHPSSQVTDRDVRGWVRYAWIKVVDAVSHTVSGFGCIPELMLEIHLGLPRQVGAMNNVLHPARENPP